MVKYRYLLLILTIGIVSTSAGMTLPARADLPLSNLIDGGDFSQFNPANSTTQGNMTIYGIPYYSGWSSLWSDIGFNAGNNTPFVNTTRYAWILDSTYCQGVGFADSCLVMGTPNGQSSMMVTNVFEFTENTSAKQMYFYIRPLYTPPSASFKAYGYLYSANNTLVATRNVEMGNGKMWNASNPNGIVKLNMSFYEINRDISTNYYIKFNIYQTTGNFHWFLDNFTIQGNTSYVSAYLSVESQCYFQNVTRYNQTLSCETPTLDTSICSRIDLIAGENTIWQIGSLSANWTQGYAFNTSNTYQETFRSWNPAPFTPATPYRHDAQFTDTSFTAYNTTRAFSTCYFPINDSFNATISEMDCKLYAYCLLNVNTTDCNSICLNGYNYLNGTFNYETGVCEDFQSTVKCPGMCSSLTSCNEPLRVWINFTNTYYQLNTTAITQSMLSIFNSGIGYAFIIFFIIEIGLYYISNEFFTIAGFTIINFIYGLLGFYPSWVGYLLALIGLEIIITNYDHFRQKNG